MNEAFRFGKLYVEAPTRKAGKKLFDWSFRDIAQDKDIPVEVHLIERDGQLLFRATCKLLPSPLVSTDIGQLQSGVERILLQHAAKASEGKWEDWLEVSVKGDGRSEPGRRTHVKTEGLELSIKTFKGMVDAETGKGFMIDEFNGRIQEMPKAQSLNQERDIQGFRLDDHAERAYIRATPENIAALAGIFDRMATLRKSLAALLGQASIESALNAVSKDQISRIEF